MKKRLTIIAVAALALLTAQAQKLDPIAIRYSGSTATVTVPDNITDVTVTVNGANVTINSATAAKEYTYKVSGSSTDGSLTINGSYKLTLQLAGLTLTNAHSGAAIDIECGKRIAVELVEGTVNRLTDAAAGSQKAALYFKGHPEFEGKGTLYVTGQTKHAIAAKEYLELKRSLGAIHVLGAVSDGIHCGKGKPDSEHNYFLMRGGTVNITRVGKDGVDSDDYGTIRVEGGALSINVEGDDATGLKADSTLTITGGVVSVAVTGKDSEGLRARYATSIEGGKVNLAVSGDGSKGIKGKQLLDAAATVREGGFVTVTGGDISIQTTGGNYTTANADGSDDVDKCMGLSVDANFAQTGGSISITALGKEAQTYKVKGTENFAGGTFETARLPWTTDALAYEKDMSAYVKVMCEVQSTKADATTGITKTAVEDYSPYAVGAFAGSECVGFATFAEGDGFGIMRIRSNASTGGQAITFKLYDYDMDIEYDLTAAKAVTFASGSCVGTPTAPLELTFTVDETLIVPVVVADNLSREYGEANPTLTFQVTEGTLEGKPELSTKALKTSDVGSYPITVGRGTIVGPYRGKDGTLTVTKAPLTATAKDCSIKQGEPLPTFEATYTGFKNGDTEAVLTQQPTFTCSATSASQPGTYAITLADADAQNYELTYKKGTLTIVQADAVVVTAKDLSREYGEENPVLEYTVTGKELDGTPVISCAATAKSPVGTYDIKVEKGTVKNYNDTYVPGTLTVTKAPLTVTAKSYTIKQGEAMPTLEATCTGFKLNETEAVLTKKPSLSCVATSASQPGTYEIVVSGAEAKNYDITFVKGTLTIVAADAVVVTAKSYTREYGEANPTFEYEAVGKALSGKPEISCDATAKSPVGTYVIKVKKGTVTNYNDTYVDGTLTITKATLTATAQSYTIKQGDPLPTFEATYTGFKNGEKETVLTQQPTFTCNATTTSQPGTYDIGISGADAQNYSFSYKKGTLTIEAVDTPDDPTPNGIDTLAAPADGRTRKVLLNGQVLIQKNGGTYRTDGVRQR